MGRVVITSGERFSDIDVLACSIAYNELLNSEGEKSTVVLPGVLNKSVTGDISKWKFTFEKRCPTLVDNYVIVDASNPDHFSNFVELNKVTEVYDHRSGYVDFWRKKIGNKAKIEEIGACATLIWEEFKKRSKKKISTVSANLLYTAIVSNTLNFNASVTHKRDINAFKDLEKLVNLPNYWIEKYFKDQEAEVFSNPAEEIKNDTKIETIANINKIFIIGQLELWNSSVFIKKHLSEVNKALESFNNPEWFITSPSISEGKNYIYTKSKYLKEMLAKTINAEFDGDLGTTKKLWLRKEIVRELQGL